MDSIIDPVLFEKAAKEKALIEAHVGYFEDFTTVKIIKYDGIITRFDPVSHYCNWETLDGKKQPAIHANSIVIVKIAPNAVKEFFDNQIEKP